MPRPLPGYRLHKASGQAIVKLGGKTHYLGKYGTPNSRRKYADKLAEWCDPNYQPPPPVLGALSIIELCDRFRCHAVKHYRKPDGRPTGQVVNFDAAMRPLLALYGELLVKDFGPLKLEACRELMVKGFTDRHGKARAGLARKVVNSRTGLLKQIFKWAVAKQLAPPNVADALKYVAGLREGRSDCREKQPVGPVSESDVEATLPHLGDMVADMVKLQRLTGCRPGEICGLRPVDIDTSGAIWLYRPASHKTEHHGRGRVIFIGPKGQLILKRYLARAPAMFCFSPAESERLRLEALHAARKTPLSNGNRPGKRSQSKASQSKGAPRPARDHYTRHSYARAIRRACQAAGVDAWTPNQLRHAAATEIRARFGLEASQVVLGHTNAQVTEIYAERNMKVGADVMKQIG